VVREIGKALTFVTPMLGAALGAYEIFRDWTKSRRGTGGVAIAKILSIQVRLGRAAADLDVAELLLRRAVDTAQTPSPPPLALRARTMVIVRAPPNFAPVPSMP
jgi:alkylation response protein AidB-like acyl-CoA dehydrogenase